MELHKVKAKIAAISDFPQKGILFRDIFPVFLDPKLLNTVIDAFIERIKPIGSIDLIAGLDARGFLLGPLVALRLGVGFVPIRKKGKLPGNTITVSYEKEYGVDYFELQKDSIKPGMKVMVVDDLLATGGSASAAAELIQLAGARVAGYAFVIELVDLKGSLRLNEVPVISLFQY